jgi:O-antigen/teichoic acid export membrane protein
MKLKRLFQILLATFLSQGVTVISQLLVPPFFLRYYGSGLSVYGEWLALSASVNYLGMLNYGIQTYANNEMTILHNAGNTNGAKAVQANALRLLLGIIAAFAAVGALVFLVPVTSWLKLHHVTPAGAQLALYLLILQIALNMLFSLLTNGYMMVGLPHVGNHMASGQRLLSTFGMAFAIYHHASFAGLAGVQLASLLIFSLVVLIHVKVVVPVLMPNLRFGNWKGVMTILRPSGHFGLISIGGFLTWSMPVILIQRTLGAEVTGIFGLVRTIFQMSRQILMIASSTISQDITEMWGRKDWVQLRRLYDLSERVVLFLIPVVTVGTLLLSPLLFTVWLHKRGMYQPELCFLMAVISGVLGIKEHKTQFQSASNEHAKLSWIIVIGYSVMLLAALAPIHYFGLVGYLVTWLIWEIIQTGMVLRLNERLFPEEYRVETKPLIKLAIFTVVGFAAAAYPAVLEQRLSLPAGIGLALCVVAVLGVAAYQVFGLKDVANLLRSRMKARQTATA